MTADDIGREIVARHGGIPPEMQGTVAAGRPFTESVSLAKFLRDGVPPPRLLCGGMLYRGNVHSLAGEPESGKTTIAMHWMLQAIRDGHHVMFLDEEGGDEIVAEKLIDLGMEISEIDRLHYFPFPHRTWSPGDIAMYYAQLDEIRPALTVFDSVSAFMALAGLKENDNADCTTFFTRVLIPAAREFHSAVVAIDHDKKESEDSRYSRGGGAKLGLVDVAYKAQVVVPFNRKESGELRLSCNSKDRRGYLHREWIVTVTPAALSGAALVLEFSHGDGSRPAADPRSGMRPATRKIYDALTAEPQTIAQITDAIAKAHGHGLKRQTVSGDLSELLSDGLAERFDMGNGRPALWSLPNSLQGGGPVTYLSPEIEPGTSFPSSDLSGGQIGQDLSPDLSSTCQVAETENDVSAGQTCQVGEGDRSVTGTPSVPVSKKPLIGGAFADRSEVPGPGDADTGWPPGTLGAEVNTPEDGEVW